MLLQIVFPTYLFMFSCQSSQLDKKMYFVQGSWYIIERITLFVSASPNFRGAAGMQISFFCFCSVILDAKDMESYLHNHITYRITES